MLKICEHILRKNPVQHVIQGRGNNSKQKLEKITKKFKSMLKN